MARKVKLKISTRLLRKKTRRGAFTGAKHCRFCANDEAASMLDYKNSGLIKRLYNRTG